MKLQASRTTPFRLRDVRPPDWDSWTWIL